MVLRLLQLEQGICSSHCTNIVLDMRREFHYDFGIKLACLYSAALAFDAAPTTLVMTALLPPFAANSNGLQRWSLGVVLCYQKGVCEDDLVNHRVCHFFFLSLARA